MHKIFGYERKPFEELFKRLKKKKNLSRQPNPG
jgi:hypothetical protein